jgi:hypothetical protein
MDDRGDDIITFVDRMFREIEPLRAIDKDEFLERLGVGWLAGDDVLIEELGKLFRP